MKYTQNEKIMQITENTLIIGVDIASEVHYARAFDYRGIELAKVIKFDNDILGFKVFSDWITDIATKNNKQHVMVGMEPTGHYWFTFAQHLEENYTKIVLVNPYHVKTTKELDDNSPTKNDRKDPKTIAMLVKDGRYMEPYIPKGIYSELRNAMNTCWQLVKKQNSIKNQIKRWIKIYFPEFNNAFADWEGKAALMTLKEFPTPKKIIELNAQKIVATWRKEISRAVGIKRATKPTKAAKKSTGIKEGLMAAENELHILLE
ncbi:MAG: transposase [Tepidanaerobacteraceae bacterium]|nr:transposase [Tepidanaerobacteraceae bacterium]